MNLCQSLSILNKQMHNLYKTLSKICPADGRRIFLWCSVRSEPVVRHTATGAVCVGLLHVATGLIIGPIGRYSSTAPTDSTAADGARGTSGPHAGPRGPRGRTPPTPPRHPALTDHTTIGHVNTTVLFKCSKLFLNRVISVFVVGI